MNPIDTPERKEFFGTAATLRQHIDSDKLIAALDYWEELPAKNGMPSRNSYDPMALPRLLPTTFLAEVEENGVFRYRLVGSMIEERYRKGPMNGKTPAEVMGDAAANVLGPYRRIRDEKTLFYREASLNWLHESHKFIQYKVLLMPFSDDGETVNIVYGVQDFIRG